MSRHGAMGPWALLLCLVAGAGCEKPDTERAILWPVPSEDAARYLVRGDEVEIMGGGHAPYLGPWSPPCHDFVWVYNARVVVGTRTGERFIFAGDSGGPTYGIWRLDRKIECGWELGP